VQATVRYAIASPRVFLFEVAEPEAILRSTAEAVLREAVAGRSFAELLTAGRGPFADDVLRRLDERCRSQGPSGLGIRLDGLAVHDLHPPQEVVADYHNVTRAMEARERQKKQAEAEVLYNPRTLTQSLQLWREAEKADGRTRLSLAEAHGLALQVVRQAQAERVEKVSAAAAGRDTFLARAGARDRLPLRGEWQLLREAYEAVRRGQAPAVAVEEYRRRRREVLQAQAVLTDFRIYWEALGRALAGRDKILIDADKVPGRRQLLMMNPEQFRVPVPMLGPPERAPMRQGRLEGHEGP
jgi:regulator of protease activity HflC (stomatin/prohibitin superfamily)